MPTKTKTDSRVYVGTYGKYNNGSIKGAWLNLADYADKEEFYAACAELHKDEHDPELMFQDHEGIPEGMISESSIEDALWDWLALDDDDKELLAVYRSDVDQGGTIEQARDAFMGTFDSEEDWAESYLDDTGLLKEVPESLRGYVDYQKYVRDAGYNGMRFVRHEGKVWSSIHHDQRSKGKTVIFIFDNGESYSNHALFFVDAPDDFGAWFNDVYRPWIDGAEYRPLMIVATAPAIERRERGPFTLRPIWKGYEVSIEDEPPLYEISTMPAVEFLAKFVEQTRDGQPRPHYRLENVSPATKQVIATCKECGGPGITTKESLEASAGKLAHKDPLICANVRRNTGPPRK